MLCYYGSTIVPNVNSSITYNGKSNFLLIDNLGMSYAEMKETICYGVEWSYNYINIEIT